LVRIESGGFRYVEQEAVTRRIGRNGSGEALVGLGCTFRIGAKVEVEVLGHSGRITNA